MSLLNEFLTLAHDSAVEGTLILLAFLALALMLAYVRLRQRQHDRTVRDHHLQLQSLAEHIPGVVFCYEYRPDRPRRLIFLGPGLADLIGPVHASRVEAKYDDIFELIHPDDRARLREHVRASHDTHQLVEVDLRMRHDSGDWVWIHTSSRPTDLGDGVTRWHGVMFDISDTKKTEDALRQNEAAIRALYEATASVDATTEQRIDMLLKVGRDCFDMELGLLAQIEGNRYTVVACSAPDDFEIAPGDEFEIGRTYCRETIASEDPVSHLHVGESDFAGHPAYHDFALESYCGARVIVQEQVFGTLSFSRRTPRRLDFTRADLDLLSLMARWVGGEIERDNARRELRWANENLEQEVRQRTNELLAANKALREQVFERERAESELQRKHRQERLLFSELDHRVRNNLSSLISLLDLTRRRSGDLDGFVRSIRGRIETIAAVHTILSQKHWSAMRLRELVDTLRPADALGSIEMIGEEVSIAARQANAFGMVVHELITNSAKHGALSRAEGKVVLSWEDLPSPREGVRRLKLVWVEEGGPPIDSRIERGSGTSIIEGLVGFELRGAVWMSYPRDGARHEITVQLDDVGDPRPQAERSVAGRSG